MNTVGDEKFVCQAFLSGSTISEISGHILKPRPVVEAIIRKMALRLFDLQSTQRTDGPDADRPAAR